MHLGGQDRPENFGDRDNADDTERQPGAYQYKAFSQHKRDYILSSGPDRHSQADFWHSPDRVVDRKAG